MCSFRREDSFENSNYISDGLNSKELIEKAQELLDKARLDAVTASTLQLSLSAAMFNFLAIPEFKKLTGMFEGGNWIRVRLDDKIYRLRLIHFSIDFSQIQNIEVEFSDVTETYNGLNDAKSLMDNVKTMAASFSYVAHQAKQGAKGFTELDTIRNDGLNAALYNISSSINQEFVIDEHGITGRQWDDISGGYLPEQVKFSNNCLVYTDDYWQTAKAALGRIEFYNPVLGENVSRYGLIADAVVSGILMGNDIVGGNVYSENYSSDGASPAGTHIDLNSGDFSFAGGRLRYDSLSNVLDVTGRITATSGSIGKWTIGKPNKSYGLNECLHTETETGIIGLQSSKYANNVAFFVKDKEGNDITYIKNNGELYSQNANISGTITATSGSIGGFTIGSSSIYNGTNSLTSTTAGIYLGTNGIRQYASSDAYTNITKGILTAKGANITGTISTDNITAIGGTIGGWNIKNNALYSDKLVSDNYLRRVFIQTLNSNNPDETWVFSIQKGQTPGDINPEHLDSLWKVSGNGDMVSGNITAQGTIFADGNVQAKGTIFADGNVQAKGAICTDDNVQAKGAICTDDNVQAKGAIFADGNVWANKSIYVADKVTVGGTTYWDNFVLNCHGNAIIDGKIEAKGTIEILNINNASNLILDNGYDNRDIYLRYDEQSRFYIVPHTSDGFDSQNCFYMDAYTGDCCARSFVNASSIRYKENIKTLSNDFINNFSKIRPVSFDYKPNVGYKNQYGLIAEEMEEIYPYVVTHDREGNCEAIDYSKLTVLLIKKIQVMDKEIERLNETISQHNINK